MLEHRCGERRDLGITVLVRRRSWGGWTVGLLRNLSVSGAWIEVDPAAFALHGTVELEATPPGTPVTGGLRCRAMVVRRTPEGLGVAFDQIRPPGLAPLFRRGPGEGKEKALANAREADRGT